MVDPVNITDFNLSTERLEEYILFCIAVAGKNATTTSKNLERLLKELHFKAKCDEWSPFKVLRHFDREYLSGLMKNFGFGCYNLKSLGFHEVCRASLDLCTCSAQDLEEISGIGPKTSRFFILHTRENAKVACLDTHILKWLAFLGHDVPKATPSGKKYLKIESLFLELAEKENMDPATLDLMIWNHYSGNVVQKRWAAA